MSQNSSRLNRKPHGVGTWDSYATSARGKRPSRYQFKNSSLPPPGPVSSRPRTSPATSRNRRQGPSTSRGGQLNLGGSFVRSISSSGFSGLPAAANSYSSQSKPSQSVVATPFLAKLFHQQQDHLQQQFSNVVTKSSGEEKENSLRPKSKSSAVDLQPIHVELLKALAQNKHYWDALQVREEEIRILKEKFVETKTELGRSNTFLAELRAKSLKVAETEQELKEVKTEHSKMKGYQESSHEEQKRLKADLKSVTKTRDELMATRKSLTKRAEEKEQLAVELGRRLTLCMAANDKQQQDNERQLTRLNDEIVQWREDYRNIALAHADCEERITTMERKMAEDTEKMSHLTVELAGLQHTHKGCDARITDLRNKLENLEDEHFGCFKRSQRQEAQIANLTEAHRNCPDTIKSTTSEVEQLRKDHKNCNSQIRSAKGELGRTRITLRETMDNLEEALVKTKLWKERFHEEEAKLAAVIAPPVTDSEAELKSVKNLLTESEKEAVFWRKKHDALMSKLRPTVASLRRLEEAREHLREQTLIARQVKQSWMPAFGMGFETSAKQVIVNSIEVGGPAALAAMNTGDVIASVGNKRIYTSKQLAEIFSQTTPLDKLEIAVLRSGVNVPLNLQVCVGAKGIKDIEVTKSVARLASRVESDSTIDLSPYETVTAMRPSELGSSVAVPKPTVEMFNFVS